MSWTRDLWDALEERLWDGDSLGIEMRNALHDGCGVTFSDHHPDPVPVFDGPDDAYDFWWWPNRGVCFVCERPEEVHMLGGRLHNDSGPAVRFRDGWSVWAIGGVRVDELPVLYPELQSLQQIRHERNAEVKRVRIERFGWLRYLIEAGAVVVDCRRNDIEATRETLFRLPNEESPNRPGEVVLVCACPSTGRVYALKVPANIRTCARAQAWLSGNLAGRIINVS
jgi:hypothetical protein